MSSESIAASPTPSDVVLRVEELSKCYRIYDHPRDRLLQAFWGGRRQLYRDFWALHPLSFELARGQTLGVVGRNGSGKSTLLQLLCGTLSPTGGRVTSQGRIGALLELGSGFSPEFTGRENVHLNAAVLGLSRAEIEARLDAILAFADIGSFIDQPVKTYSSGMVVRLAFAVQAHIDPDLLVVDEALAVGDELFQKKCYAHLERLKERGTSVLLVTHSCPQIIQHCDQALLLHKGRARMLDEPARVTVTYQRLINASDEEWEAAFSKPTQPAQASHSDSHSPDKPTRNTNSEKRAWLDANLEPQSTEIYPSHGARIIGVQIERTNGELINPLPFGEDFALVFSYEADADLQGIGLACHIASHTGQRISGQTLPALLSPSSNVELLNVSAGQRWKARFHFRGGLWPGLYFIGGGVVAFNKDGRTFVHRVVDFCALRILEIEPLSVVGGSALQAAPPQVLGLDRLDA